MLNVGASTLKFLIYKIGVYEPDILDLIMKMVPLCPNILLCDGVNNKYNDVCYKCDMSLYGVFNKRITIIRGFYPCIEHTPEFNYSNCLRYTEIPELLLKLGNSRHHILNIEKKYGSCHSCYKTGDFIFIRHPTCNLHEVCKSCFKDDFLDEGIKEPIAPGCIMAFEEFVDDLIENSNLQYDRFNGFLGGNDLYFDHPLDEWPIYIKEMYSGCRIYEKDRFVYENKLEKNASHRSCPVCNCKKMAI